MFDVNVSSCIYLTERDSYVGMYNVYIHVYISLKTIAQNEVAILVLCTIYALMFAQKLIFIG